MVKNTGTDPQEEFILNLRVTTNLLEASFSKVLDSLRDYGNCLVFLAIGTTFKLALSHDDFAVFALEGTVILLQISLSISLFTVLSIIEQII